MVVLMPFRLRPAAEARAQLRLRPLAWLLGGFVAGAVVGALADGLGLPGGGTVGWLTGLAAGSLASASAARRARRALAAETALPRRPQQLALADAPAPDARALARQRRLMLVVVAVEVAFAIAVLVATPLMASQPDRSDSGLPPMLAWVLAPALAAGMGLDARRWWRAARRSRRVGVADLEPGYVTVLGFGGPHNSEVVFVPGATSAGAAFALLHRKAGIPDRFGRNFGGPVLAGPIGRKLGDLVAGDVLVCHGVLKPGGFVQLSNAAGHAWVPSLRIPYRPEIFKEPYEEPDAVREANQAARQLFPYRSSPIDGVAGRNVRVIPSPDGAPGGDQPFASQRRSSTLLTNGTPT